MGDVSHHTKALFATTRLFTIQADNLKKTLLLNNSSNFRNKINFAVIWRLEHSLEWHGDLSEQMCLNDGTTHSADNVNWYLESYMIAHSVDNSFKIIRVHCKAFNRVPYKYAYRVLHWIYFILWTLNKSTRADQQNKNHKAKTSSH